MKELFKLTRLITMKIDLYSSGLNVMDIVLGQLS